MKILAIESSCDETSVAVVEDRTVLSNIVSTQVEEHKIYGGVVPEIASRRHTEAISAVCDEALKVAGIGYSDIDAVAVTFAPGLIGALLVGVNFAKGLSMSLGVPLIPVHHLRSHIAANYLAHPDLKPPFLCLLVSGGNTVIAKVSDYTKFEIIGQTRDDAAGECFDKAARAMGLPYPGGVHLDRLAQNGNPHAFSLPRPQIEGCPHDFSFSGLKTAVINLLHTAEQRGETVNTADLAASFQHTVCDILSSHVLDIVSQTGDNTVVLAGGVSANSGLRRRMEEVCRQHHLTLYYPPLSLCGDNAAMVGAQAYYEHLAGHIADDSLNAFATLPIEK